MKYKVTIVGHVYAANWRQVIEHVEDRLGIEIWQESAKRHLKKILPIRIDTQLEGEG